MFYVLTCPEPEHLRVALISYLPDDLNIDWATGSRMASVAPVPVEALIEPGDEGDMVDLIKVPLPLMSHRLADALRDAGVDNIEYFPCSILVESTGEVIDDMLAFNIVGTVACADLAKSEFEDEGGMGVISLTFDKLILDPSRATGLKVFRLAEYTPAIMVHETVRTFLEQRGFADLVFTEPTDWGN